MFENIGNLGSGFMTFLFDVFLYVVIGLVFVGLFSVIFYFGKFNKRIVIRKKINGQNKIFYDRARRVEKDGVVWWKLLRAKVDIPVPPDNAIEVDKKGKDFVELYQLESGEFIPLIDDNKEINSVQPFTSNQRQLLQGQFKKANLERGFKFTDYIGAIAYISALVIIVISLMVFYGDMAKPLIKMGDKLASFQDKQVELQKELNVMVDKLSKVQNGLLEASFVASEPRNMSIRGVPN